MKKKESCLEILKKDYNKIQKKHSLPHFERLNEDFQIEKISEIETDFLIREVRRMMAEKLSNYLKFIDTLLHPINAPMFIFSIIKTINLDDKKMMEEIYKKLIKIEVDLIELDTEYLEKKEVKFIKETYEEWQKMKKDILKMIESIKKNWNNKYQQNNKGYLG